MQNMKMNQPILQRESSNIRRKLFKNIWDAAWHADKNGEILKPKIIKTMRIDEVNVCNARRKKQKIKNLRHVCKKILEYCNRQENADLQNKMKLFGKGSGESGLPYIKKTKLKTKMKKISKNIKCTKATVTSGISQPGEKNLALGEEKLAMGPVKKSKNPSPIKIKRPSNKNATKTKPTPVRKLNADTNVIKEHDNNTIRLRKFTKAS